MPKAFDLVGRSFGRLTVMRFVGRREIGSEMRRLWECHCVCGNDCVTSGKSLLIGYTTSCGCAKVVGVLIHGETGTSEHNTWKAMIQRCTNPKSNSYLRYGGRGITVCDRWRQSFDDFLSDMGKKPTPDLTIERKNNDGNYEPSNCVWADRTTQILNSRPKNTNRSGVVGVHWDPSKKKWRAQISLRCKKVALGEFNNIEDAKAAREAAVAERMAAR